MTTPLTPTPMRAGIEQRTEVVAVGPAAAWSQSCDSAKEGQEKGEPGDADDDDIRPEGNRSIEVLWIRRATRNGIRSFREVLHGLEGRQRHVEHLRGDVDSLKESYV